MTAVNLNAAGNIRSLVQSVAGTNSSSKIESAKGGFEQVMKEKAGEKSASAKTSPEEAVKQPTRTQLKDSDSSKARALSKSKKQPETNKKSDAPETADEMLAGAAEVLNITPEELKEALEAIGLKIEDLTDRNNVAQLILSLNGSTDVSDMLVDNGMLETFNELNDFIAETLSEAGMSASEFKDLIAADREAALAAGTVRAAETEPEEELKVRTADDEEEFAPVVQEASKEPEITIETEGAGNENGSSLTEKSDRDGSVKSSGKDQANVSLAENFVRNLEMAVESTQEVDGNIPDVREIVYQVVERIRVSISPENTSMEMHLNPENLGRVSINITSKAGVMTATINTENRQAREAIESQLQILKENIEAKGIRVEAVEVRISDFNFADSRNSESSTDNQNEERSGNRRRTGGISAVETDEVTEARRIAQEVLSDTGSTVSYTA